MGRLRSQAAERPGRGFRTRLVRRALRAGIDLPASLADSLLAYYELLTLWNRRVNLTAIQDPDHAIDRLLLEPVVAARRLPAGVQTVLDVGSGGGSPAIPLKLASPGLVLTMVEAKARKAAFLREAVRQLDLSDAFVEPVRYEELLTRPEMHECFDALSLRAVRIDARVLMNLQAFLKPGGTFCLFRAAAETDLAGSLPPSLVVTNSLGMSEPLRSRLLLIRKIR